MSNSNYLAGCKCNKNWQKGLSWPNFTKYNDWKCLFICFITCFSTFNCAFRLTKWNSRQKITIINLKHIENSYSGHTKQAKGPHAARGPPIWHAWSSALFDFYDKFNFDLVATPEKCFVVWRVGKVFKFIKRCMLIPEFYNVTFVLCVREK